MKVQLKGDVVIIGAGLAGITTAIELLDRSNLKILLLDRDTPEKLGGLARESFGGIMMVDTPLQRKAGIRDTVELALADWLRVARFESRDTLPRAWAETYVYRSSELLYPWLTNQAVSFLPVINWPERGMLFPANSVPRWHITWGTGYGLMEAIIQHLQNHPRQENVTMLFNKRVERLESRNGQICGCSGIDEGDQSGFRVEAGITVLAAGGICGGDLGRVKAHWHPDWGAPPDYLLNGSHQYADAMVHDAAVKSGALLTHLEKQWHYAAGIPFPKAGRPDKGLSLVPPRSALWFNALGRRIGPPPLVGYTDTRYLVEQICKQPGKFSWQIMNRNIAKKELAVSGSDYMTAFREKKKLLVLKQLLFGNNELVDRLIKESDHFIIADSLPDLAMKIQQNNHGLMFNAEHFIADVEHYDNEIERGKAFFTDEQLRWLVNFRSYRGDRLRLCKFQKIDDPGARPLIAIREYILSRKSLGGIKTDLKSRVVDKKDKPISGLYAVGEAAGFGGGGIHGMGSLEGTFLGSCILTGRICGEAIAEGYA